MDITSAKRVLHRTHLAAIRAGHRANGYYLESGPGIGKSDSQRQACAALAAELNRPVGLVVFMLATVSSVDVRGFMLPVKGDGKLDTVFSTPPWYPTAANTIVFMPDGTVSKPGSHQAPVPDVGILFLDEFAQAEDDVKKPAAELMLNGNVGTCELPVGWRVVAAGNRLKDRSGAVRELMFLVNRRCRLSIDASLPAWLAWANAQEPEQRPHYLTLSFAQKNPDLVFRDAVPAGSDPFCTPRTLCLMDRDLRALRSVEDVAQHRLPLDGDAREVCAGWIGAGEAAQFFTHLKYADELPDIADIERAPAKAKMPSNRDAQMVAGYMLAHHLTTANAAALVTYLGRMHKEMQVVAMRALVAQPNAEARLATPAVQEWLVANQALLRAARGI